ncbi:MAG: glycosyltransferase [Fusobacterium sp.]
MKINLVGCLPPPYGGISIHIKRIYKKLKSKNNLKIYTSTKESVLLKDDNIKSMSLKLFFIKLLLLSRKEIFHFHVSGKKVKIILGLFSIILRKKIILTIHGDSLKKEFYSSNFFIKKVLEISIKNLNHIIVVNNSIKKECLKLGVKENKISVIPAYLNPIINEDDYKKIDMKVWNFISKRKKDEDRIITGNGNIKFYNNQDLYGLDLLINLIYKLSQKNYKASLVFALLGYEGQSKIERDYFEKLLKKIEQYNLEERVFIYKVKDTEYYPIMDKSDVFIRPTNTDGDAISLRESIYLNKPNISSDIVERPEGTLLFKTRDIDDLFNKTINILDNYEEEVKKIEKIQVREYYKEILEVYKKVDKER